MKETKIKEIITKSKLETSPDFTHLLMQQLEIKKEAKRTITWPFRNVFLGVSCIVIALSYVLFRFFNLSSFIEKLELSQFKMPFFLVASAVVFMGMNYLIRLNETYKYLDDKELS